MKSKLNNEKKVIVEYLKYIPGGNDTALVIEKQYNSSQKKIINDYILNQDKTIEQVGFVNKIALPELQMAGGEFCGNATRSAAYFYLNGKLGTINILVNGKDKIQAGVHKDGKAWCEIPLYQTQETVVKKEEGIYQVKMKGMVSIVVQENIAKKYIDNISKIKESASEFIDKYKLRDNQAVGIIFLEKKEILKIHPVVWVKEIDTLYYETACGSGTTAAAIVQSYLLNKNQKLEIEQPSGLTIVSEITIDNGKITKAIISGNIMTDNIVRKKEIYCQ